MNKDEFTNRNSLPGASANRMPPSIWLRGLCGAALCFSLLTAVIASRHWPLIGDASLMHYVVFLMHHGLLPYKNIADINLPGTYAFEAAAMALFGEGAIAWRIYDFTLLGAALGACFLLAGRNRWFAALFAGCTFALVHLQDGLEEGGQRDLLIAVLLLWSYVALFAALRGKRPLRMLLLFGVSLGATFLVKPILLPLSVLLLLLIGVIFYRRRQKPVSAIAAALAGMAIPGICALLWLQSHGALSAFWTSALPLIRLHARLGDRSLGFLLAHCLSPITALCLLWVVLQFTGRPSLTTERIALLLGVFGTLLAYVLQGKGFTYQRYPQLAVLLILIGLDLDDALFSKGIHRFLAIATCLLGSLFLAPRFAWLTTTFSGVTRFQNALTERLDAVASRDQLSGQIQCLDTFGGCIGTLYQMRLPQSTGFLYDCYLFTDPSAERERYRAAFWAAYKTAQPRVLVVTNQFCFWDPRGFKKLDEWPALAADLNQNYREQSEWHSDVPNHFWHRPEMPFQFRIYVRKERP
jgi:hypothetical protein